MLQDRITIEENHKRFVTKICETQIVIGLESPVGFATSNSNNFENEDGEPAGIICFWSEKALAKSCAKEGWEIYKVVEIPLSEFIENWCIGMSNDGLLVGSNFNQNMFGNEIEPLELILEIITETKKTNGIIEFEKFESLDDLENKIREILE